MIIDTNISLTVKCHICKEKEEHSVSLFSINSIGYVECECSCGKSNLVIRKRDYKRTLTVSCIECQIDQTILNEHMERINMRFIEDNNYTYKGLDFDGYFTNFEIMLKCVEKVHKLQDKKNVYCDCGSNKIEVKLFNDRIELKCLNCHSIKMIYAENEEDYKNICEKDFIEMHKNSFECIDAINMKNDRKK